MDDKDVIILIEKLLSKTKSKELKWGRTNRLSEYLAALVSGNVVIDSWEAGDDAYRNLTLFNKRGDRILNIQNERGGSFFGSLTELHEAARENYYRADETIDSMIAELEKPGRVGTENIPVSYGMQVRLRHIPTGVLLMSLDKAYCHHDSSKQQMVVGTGALDKDSLWLVKGSYEQGDSMPVGEPIKRGCIVRLEHVSTKKHLHSHGDRHAPIDFSQQEVTAWRDIVQGDINDNWIVEPESGDGWVLGQPMRLIHRETNKALHSHRNGHPVYTAGFQEVTGFRERDENDLWVCNLSDQP